MLNHVTLLGRLAQDPQVRQTQTGVPVASFDLAVAVPSKDKDTPPDYIPVVCWRETADLVGRYLAKGRQIAVEGRISTRKYTDQDGKNRKVVEVVATRVYFVGSKDGQSGQGAAQSAPPAAEPPAFTPENGFTQVDDDGLPF